MEFGVNSMVLMDEISTGLGSAATFDIINTQRSVAKKLKNTIVIALLQPALEVFNLFDDVMILNDCEVMCHEPTEQVESYFVSLGFIRPSGRDVPDFLLDLGIQKQRHYQCSSPAAAKDVPTQPSEFGTIFRVSTIHQEMIRSRHDPKLLMLAAKDMNPMPEAQQTFWENVCLLMRRQAMLIAQNTAFLRGCAIIIIMIGLINASTFWNVDPKKV